MKLFARKFSWLLIWIGCGAVFLGALGFLIDCVIAQRNRVVLELTLVKDLEFAVRSFEAEYHRYPLCGKEPLAEDARFNTANSRLVSSLLGQDIQDNLLQIQFMDFPIAGDGKCGLIESKDGRLIVDSWGNPFEMIFDTNRDSRIQSPDLRNQDLSIVAKASDWIPVRVIVFGRGQDAVLHSRDDNTSWRGMGSRAPFIYPSLNLLAKIGFLFTIIGTLGVFFLPRNKSASPVSHTAPS